MARQAANACTKAKHILSACRMSLPPPEVSKVTTRRVWCDGATDIRTGKNYRSAALGHPKIYLEIDEHGYVDCGYCDRRFVLEGGPADGVDQSHKRSDLRH